MTQIANGPAVATVMARLAELRPVFHSEADFQHAFAQAVHALAPSLHVRLEVRQDVTPGRAEHLDLLCFSPGGRRTAIEFKYVTHTWAGTDPHTEEVYSLRSHSAWDLARLGYVRDVRRLERFCDHHANTDGVAILVTNAATLWKSPPTRYPSRDRAYRIHEGVQLQGELIWGDNDYPKSNLTLRGRYPITWHEYANVPPDTNVALRWTAVSVTPGPSDRDGQ